MLEIFTLYHHRLKKLITFFVAIQSFFSTNYRSPYHPGAEIRSLLVLVRKLKAKLVLGVFSER